MFYHPQVRTSAPATATTPALTVHVRRGGRGEWMVWQETAIACELLGAAPPTDARAAHDRLIQAINDRRPGPQQRWLLDTRLRQRQLVVQLGDAAPCLCLLDADAAGLPVLLSWPLRTNGARGRPSLVHKQSAEAVT